MQELIHSIPAQVKDLDAYVEAFLSQFEKTNWVESASLGGIPGSSEIALWIYFAPKSPTEIENILPKRAKTIGDITAPYRRKLSDILPKKEIQ